MISFNTILEKFDEQLKQQLREYQYRATPAGPVNEPEKVEKKPKAKTRKKK